MTKNRPQSGAAPVFKSQAKGHDELTANNWYEGLELHGNTSINPFFYGTYLGETKPGEPVTRSKKQAFQADAVGAAHQLTPAHFNRTHTFRVEWQPGPGGRLDWFSMGHRINDTFTMEGDGLGKDWVHVYGIKDEVLKKTMGSQIPIEPTYLIFNTAVSSTWGFPYSVPPDCNKCYDCDDPKCDCALGPGFCKMLREKDVALYIDSVRVYQSRDPSAHVGADHTVGCDPPDYPTRGWIKGHEYQYMRNAPFSYNDKGPLKKIQKGGGKCVSDDDCGGSLQSTNWTAIHESQEGEVESRRQIMEESGPRGQGKCVDSNEFKGMFSANDRAPFVCLCYEGYTGPRCLAQEHVDDTESAYNNMMNENLLVGVPRFRLSPFMIFVVVALFVQAIAVGCYVTKKKKKDLNDTIISSKLRKTSFRSNPPDRLISGTSI